MSNNNQDKPVKFHISCPSCRSTFRLATDMIRPGGRHVKCSKCKHIWIYRAKINDLYSDNEVNKNGSFDTPKQTLENQNNSKNSESIESYATESNNSNLKSTSNSQDGSNYENTINKDIIDKSPNILDPAISKVQAPEIRAKANSELEDVVSIMESIKHDISSEESKPQKNEKDSVSQNIENNTEEDQLDKYTSLAKAEYAENKHQHSSNSIFDDSDFINNILINLSTVEENKKESNKISNSKLNNATLDKNLDTSINIGDPIAEERSNNNTVFGQTLPKKEIKSAVSVDKSLSANISLEETIKEIEENKSDTISPEQVSAELQSILEDVSLKSNIKTKSEDANLVDQGQLAKDWEESELNKSSNSQFEIDNLLVPQHDENVINNLEQENPKSLVKLDNDSSNNNEVNANKIRQSSFFERYFKKRKEKKIKRLQKKKVSKALKQFRFSTKTAGSNVLLVKKDANLKTDNTNQKNDVTSTKATNKLTTNYTPNQTVYSKLREIRLIQENERKLEEKKVRKKQAENFEEFKAKAEEEIKPNVIPWKFKVINFISQTVNFLVISSVVVGLWYFIIGKKDEIILKWPEAALVYQSFGFDVYAKGEKVQLIPPTISIVPFSNNKRKLQFRGTLKSTFSDRDQAIPNLFVLIKELDGSIIDQWEIVLDQNILAPGQEIEYSDNRVLPQSAELLIIGFRIESLKLEEEYRFIKKL